MWQRCTNESCKSYRYYGGRGIKVCKAWEDFDTFLHDMGPKPEPHEDYSIDRYPNNDGNYEKRNCRWATWEQQANNKFSNAWWSINQTDIRKTRFCILCDKRFIPTSKMQMVCERISWEEHKYYLV